MSWNGFVKAVNRATTSVMQSAGAIEKTVDKDFEVQEKRFKTFESKMERLHKEAKEYLDAVRATTLAQQRVAETVDSFYDETSALHDVGKLYADAMKRMDEEARTELDTNYRATVLEPVSKLVGVFPDYNEAIKKRSKKLLDYDRLRSNVRRLVEKPSDDPSKLPKMLIFGTDASVSGHGGDQHVQAEAEANQARDIYDNINRQLVSDIPELINLRIAYLNPSFEAAVKSQLAFNEAAFCKIEGVVAALPKDMDRRSLEGRVENVLLQLRELSICRST